MCVCVCIYVYIYIYIVGSTKLLNDYAKNIQPRLLCNQLAAAQAEACQRVTFLAWF